MAGRVGDDEFALLGVEEPIGHVDGDALLSLGFQTIQQQREINLFARRPVLAGIALENFDLVFKKQLGIK